MHRSPRQLFAIGAIAIAATVVAITLNQGEGDPAAVSAGTPDVTSETTEANTGGDPEPAFVPPDLGLVPEIVDISGWLNTDGSSFAEVSDTVTIVQFWTFGCHNCRATLPHLQQLYAERHDDGLEIIGIHAHEFDRERDPANVAEAVADLGVTWPVALDTNKTNFVAWQGSPRYWPRTYVIDQDGRIRFDHIGEGKYDELAATVDALLAEQVENGPGPA